MQQPTPYFVSESDTCVPNEIAQGGWGPTLGGQVVGGLLARAVEGERADVDLVPPPDRRHPHRVATAPVRVHAEVVRVGRRMQAIDATMIRAASSSPAPRRSIYGAASSRPNYRGPQTFRCRQLPRNRTDSMSRSRCSSRHSVATSRPRAEESSGSTTARSSHGSGDRALVDDEVTTPFIRAALAVDVTASVTGFSRAGLGFINADFTLTLCRLPEGPYIGLAALTRYSADGIATGTASLFDAVGPIGTG